jgi:Tfp pilus assembly protein PilF
MALVGPPSAHAERTALDTATITHAMRLLDSAPDSALMLMQGVVQHWDALPSAAERGRALLVLGSAQQATGELPAALASYHRAEQEVEAAWEAEPDHGDLLLLLVDIRLQVGLLHYTLRDYDKSIALLGQALHTLEEVPVGIDPAETDLRKVRVFNNLASVYLQRYDYVSALPYFEQAAALNKPLHNVRNEASLDNNIGICHMELGAHDKAEQYFLLALALRKQTDDVGGQAQALNNLGKNQVLLGRFTQARTYYEQALALGRSAGNMGSMVVSLESLSSLYDTLGYYREAFTAFRAFKQLSDSLHLMENRAAVAKMEFAYRRQKDQKAVELELQRKDAEHARRRIINWALAGALVLLLLAGFLAYKVMRARVRTGRLEQDKLRLQQEKLEAGQAALKESLETRERELAANALFLLKKNDIISHVAERLLQAKNSFRQENQQIIQDIVRDLEASKDDDSWQEFEAHFTRVHGNFYQSLQERFPALTPNERKLCAFLRLNLSTKDISAITHQSVNSITVARSRLRKKLQIEGEEVNLTDFLLSI